MKIDEALGKIASTFDRFQEAHFWIHGLENFYHDADPFRWHLNAFLRSLKEVPQLLQMELQNQEGFVDWFRARREALMNDPLIAALSKKRDLILHRSMLVPNSKGAIGITELRGMKLGFSIPINPLEDSSEAMMRYLRVVKEKGDVLGILNPDEDSLPCVQREWRISEFPDEIVDVCSRAWLRVGETVGDVLKWMGADVPPLSLDCRHSSQQVRFKLFEREKLTEQLKKLK